MICISCQILFGLSSQGERLAEHVARMGEIGTACRILVGKPEGNNHLWLPKRGLENDRTD
jgi:hypothetical protein